MKNRENANDEIRIRIAYFRKKKGLTQNDVADAIGMARSTYSYYETKAVRFTPDFLKDVAKVLGISPNVFDVDAKFDNTVSKITLNNTFSSETPTQEFSLTKKEENIIKIFRTLPEENQEIVINTLFNECRKHMDID